MIMMKLLLILELLISTGNAMSLTDEYIEQSKQCKNGDAELCIKLGDDIARQIEKFPELPRAHEPFFFYAMACFNKSITGCLLAAQALEDDIKTKD